MALDPRTGCVCVRSRATTCVCYRRWGGVRIDYVLECCRINRLVVERERCPTATRQRKRY